MTIRNDIRHDTNGVQLAFLADVARPTRMIGLMRDGSTG